MTDFSNAKVGMDVSTISFGDNCKITSIEGGGSYPIVIQDLGGHEERYAIDGKLYLADKHPSAFYGATLPKFEIPPPPQPYLKVDTLLRVWGEDEESVLRYFAHWCGDTLCCFEGGRTSRTEQGFGWQAWKNWEIVE